jgi:hypothetical protein
MQIGDNVRVRATGRRARIIEDHGHARYRILFYAEPAVDALDGATMKMRMMPEGYTRYRTST